MRSMGKMMITARASSVTVIRRVGSSSVRVSRQRTGLTSLPHRMATCSYPRRDHMPADRHVRVRCKR